MIGLITDFHFPNAFLNENVSTHVHLPKFKTTGLQALDRHSGIVEKARHHCCICNQWAASTTQTLVHARRTHQAEWSLYGATAPEPIRSSTTVAIVFVVAVVIVVVVVVAIVVAVVVVVAVVAAAVVVLFSCFVHQQYAKQKSRSKHALSFLNCEHGMYDWSASCML